MAQDESSASPLKGYMTEGVQALTRMPSSAHSNKQGFSQAFRGVVGTNSTVTLYTSWPVNWSPGLIGSDVSSELVIYTSSNRVGTGTVIQHGERIADGKANASKVTKVWKQVSRLNRIQAIIRAPIDQVLEMEVAFGNEYSGSNLWRSRYASGARYKLTSTGNASFAMIRLTCNNPINPGPFNFIASISLTQHQEPDPEPPSLSNATIEEPGFLDELKDSLWDGIRSINQGHFPFR